jgi:hypothetical protein
MAEAQSLNCSHEAILEIGNFKNAFVVPECTVKITSSSK